MPEERKVRSANGVIPWHSDEEQGFTIEEINEWRVAEDSAGRRGSLKDFYAVHGLCFNCLASGAHMIGWCNPANEIDIKAATNLALSNFHYTRFVLLAAVPAESNDDDGSKHLRAKTNDPKHPNEG